ncbi:Periplasmic serine endoprotease DegP precursor [Novipirellula galeiformis]|uniref:Periplasmic serine endoprotease DegP n=1 Tax=Novipirellula galeiformis TaxID=2528004 RepID=A0A5C6BFA4_9BACT|nr:PDZ domain-containing protein [Novipirellula galeiformis]TWU10317.1 Periplasmic serine endoprotease DegP precursor [Novipirellula galeiformis]
MVHVASLFLIAGTVSGQTLAEDGEYRRAMAEAVRATANHVLPSVVVVEVIGASGSANGEVQQDAPTSGVIVDEEGYILASSIVVRRASASILVVLPDGTRHAAEAVAKDEHRDLVLLRIKTDTKLNAIALPDQINVRTGQTAVAVARYGIDASPLISRGVMSGNDRLDGIALQADARVSASFYGGVLVDLYGNPLGILIPAVAEGGAEADTDWYDSGIAFAIPLDRVKKNLARMRAGNDIKKGLIGIVSKSKDPYENQTELAAIRLRSPAEAAGLKAGDKVRSVNGSKVQRYQDVRLLLGRYDAGDSISIEVDREGEIITFDVTLADSIPPLKPQRLGVIAIDTTPESAKASDAPKANADNAPAAESKDGKQTTRVVVSESIAGTPADGKLRAGDVLEKIGAFEIDDVESLRRQMISAEPGKVIELTVRRAGAKDGDASETISLTPESIDNAIVTAIPKAWSDAGGKWSINELKLPDAANVAAVLAPEADESLTRMGLMVLLMNPGESAPQEVLQSWSEVAEKTGVVVCAVAAEDNKRWQPKEIEVIGRLVASIQKSSAIAPLAVAVVAPGAISGVKAEASDSMALAVAISASRTFYGVAVAAETRPPAVRLRENDAEASLQIMLPIGKDVELPSWAPTLQKSGYPVIRGGDVDRETLLRWVRLLQAV